MDAVSRFIDINKWIIDINNSFIDINKYGLNVKTAAHTHPLMQHITITPTGIHKLLCTLKEHKATGPDHIPTKLLKTLADELTPTFTLFFQASLKQGTTISINHSLFAITMSQPNINTPNSDLVSSLSQS